MVRTITFTGVFVFAESEYRPLLPYSESTSQILLSSLNPVDNRKWRRESWSWKVLKVLKVCRNLIERASITTKTPDLMLLIDPLSVRCLWRCCFCSVYL